MWTVLAVALVATLLCIRPGAAAAPEAAAPCASRRGAGVARLVRCGSGRRGPGSRRSRVARVLALLLAVGAVAWSVRRSRLAPTRLGIVTCDAPEDSPCSELVVVDPRPAVLVTAPIVAVALVGCASSLVGPPAPGPPPRRPARTSPPATSSASRPHAGVGVALWAGLIVAAALAEATGAWFALVSAVAGPACLCFSRRPSSCGVRARTRRTPPSSTCATSPGPAGPSRSTATTPSSIPTADLASR